MESNQVGLLGYPLKHSVSSVFQQAAFDHFSLPIKYVNLNVDSSEFPDAVSKLRQNIFLGANVTIPYKEKIINLIDEVSDLALNVGAINTILNSSGKLLGFNTDVDGFVDSLKFKLNLHLPDKNIVVIGAGGAARAAVYGLFRENVGSVTIYNRTFERSKILSTQFPDLSIAKTLDDLKKVCLNAALIVNCTSVGMAHTDTEDVSPIDVELISEGSMVFDMVYNPSRTKLIKECEQKNIKVVGGLWMLVYQGAKAFKIWTNKEAPMDLMYDAAMKAILDF